MTTPHEISPQESAAIQTLGRLVKRRERLEDEVLLGIRIVFAAGGTWTTVGMGLGVSAQAAWERYHGRLSVAQMQGNLQP